MNENQKKQFESWQKLITRRLRVVQSDVKTAVQLFTNDRSYEFDRIEAEHILSSIETQIAFVRQAYVQGTPAGINRASFSPESDELPGLTKQQKAFRRLSRRRIGIRLLPHLASIGTASRRTSYSYPYEIGLAISDAVDEIVAPLSIIIKKSIDEDYVINGINKKCDSFKKNRNYPESIV